MFLLSAVFVFTGVLFSFHLSEVQAAACQYVTAVDQSICPSGLKDKIVAGLADINKCMETTRDRRSLNLKGSIANDIMIRDEEKDKQDKQDQDKRMLQLPSCKCCNATGGGGAGCPHWRCVGPGGCRRRRDLVANMDTTEEDGRQLLVAGFDFASYGFTVLDNSKCLPLKDGSAWGKCLINAVTASYCN
ncbi:hypothetical protein ACA910_015593 [Epithemia clementina (nom. ined.)]